MAFMQLQFGGRLQWDNLSCSGIKEESTFRWWFAGACTAGNDNIKPGLDTGFQQQLPYHGFKVPNVV
jgi:hypothetical protein